MKRISTVATVVSAGLLFALTFSSPASASVLCDQSPLENNWNCPPDKTYGVGDKLHFESSNVKVIEQWAQPMFSCQWSEVDMTITNAGAPWGEGHPQAEITNLAFLGCTNPPTIHSNGTALIKPVAWGSLNGRFDISGNSFSVETPFGYCTFSIAGDPELIAESWRSRLRFGKTELANSSSSECPNGLMYATYQTPDLIYVFPE